MTRARLLLVALVTVLLGITAAWSDQPVANRPPPTNTPTPTPQAEPTRLVGGVPREQRVVARGVLEERLGRMVPALADGGAVDGRARADLRQRRRARSPSVR